MKVLVGIVVILVWSVIEFLGFTFLLLDSAPRKISFGELSENIDALWMVADASAPGLVLTLMFALELIPGMLCSDAASWRLRVLLLTVAIVAALVFALMVVPFSVLLITLVGLVFAKAWILELCKARRDPVWGAPGGKLRGIG